ncbi:uncharacterized protein LOC106145044 isoform X4 [Ictidomys tridecemlineatus]
MHQLGQAHLQDSPVQYLEESLTGFSGKVTIHGMNEMFSFYSRDCSGKARLGLGGWCKAMREGRRLMERLGGRKAEMDSRCLGWRMRGELQAPSTRSVR